MTAPALTPPPRFNVDQFWAKVDKSGPVVREELGACWNWTGALYKEGYGAFSVHRKARGAHRVAWEMEHGPIPPGLFVCHRCDNRRCIRSTHLFLGTQADNIADCRAKGRLSRGSVHGASERAKTHCPSGHEYDAENTYLARTGNTGWKHRVCRKCHAEQERERKRKRREGSRATEAA